MKIGDTVSFKDDVEMTGKITHRHVMMNTYGSNALVFDIEVDQGRGAESYRVEAKSCWVEED